MDMDQETITEAFGWTSVAAILFVFLVFSHRLLFPFVWRLFHSGYKVSKLDHEVES